MYTLTYVKNILSICHFIQKLIKMAAFNFQKRLN